MQKEKYGASNQLFSPENGNTHKLIVYIVYKSVIIAFCFNLPHA